MSLTKNVPNPVRESTSQPYGISSIAKAQLFFVNVVEDVRVGAGVEKTERTYLAAFQEDGQQVLVMYPYLQEEAAWRPATPQLREDFLRKLRVGTLPQVSPPALPPNKYTVAAEPKAASQIDVKPARRARARTNTEDGQPSARRKNPARAIYIPQNEDAVSPGDDFGDVDDLPAVR